MAQEVQNEVEVLEFKRKMRAKKRWRGVLIALNGLLLGYLIFVTSGSVVDFVIEKTKKQNQDLITLNGKSSKQSKKIYDDFIASNVENTVSINDYFIYGNYLHVNEYNSSIQSMSSFEELLFVKVGSGQFYNINLDYDVDNSLNKGVDLFSLSKGDYFILANYKDSTGKPKNKGDLLQLNKDNYVEETIYSLPNKDGKRTKVSIKGKSSSPALVVSVTDVNVLPNNYYDVTIIDQSGGTIKNEDLRIKTLSGEKALLEAYKVQSPYKIVLDENQKNEIVVSHYVDDINNNADLILEGALKNYDNNSYIRELGGYIFKAGTCQANVDGSCALSSLQSTSHIGSFVYSVNSLEAINTILEAIKK